MSYRNYPGSGVLAAALLAGAAVTASAQSTGPLVGTNYANGNRYNRAIQIADLDAMKAAGVGMIRTPLENYYGSYDGSHNLFAAAIMRGIGCRSVPTPRRCGCRKPAANAGNWAPISDGQKTGQLRR